MNSPLFIMFLLFVFSITAKATTYHKKWRSSEQMHDFKQGVRVCSARTTGKGSSGILHLNFPKNSDEMPVIKIKSRSYNKTNYIGAHFRMNGYPTLYGFPVGEKENQVLHFIPSSPEQLEAFMRVVRGNSDFRMLKFFVDGNQVKAHAADFSVSGSSIATDAIRNCTSAKAFLSEQQKNLIRSYSLYFNQATVQPVPRADTFRFIGYGGQISENLQDISKVIHPLYDLTNSRSSIENNSDFIEWSDKVPAFRLQYATNNAIETKLKDNQAFFQVADVQIQSLVDRNAEIVTENLAIDARVLELKGLIDAAIVVLVGLYKNEEDAKNEYDTALNKWSLKNAAVLLTSSNLGSARIALDEAERELNKREDDLEDKRDDMNRASARYRNRDQIRRDIEGGLYDQYGGSPSEIRDVITTYQRRIDRSERIMNRSRDYKSEAQAISNKANAVLRLNRNLGILGKQLKCFQGIEVGTGLAGCVQLMISERADANTRMNREIIEIRSARCPRINRRQCQNAKDQKILGLQSKISANDIVIGELQVRKALIEDTGVDEQREQMITNLQSKRKDLRTRRDGAVKEINDLIANIQVQAQMGFSIDFIFNDGNPTINVNLPGNRRRGDGFRVVNNLKNCQAKAKAPCLIPAENVVKEMTSIFDRAKKTNEINEGNIEQAEIDLENLENALERELVGLNDRLYDDMKKYEDLFYDNLDRIDELRDEVVPTSEARILSLEQSLEAKTIQLAGLEQVRDTKLALYNNATKAISDYKISVLYDANITEKKAKEIKKAQNLAESKLNDTNRLAKIARKNAIALEIDSYPARIADAEIKAAEAFVYLQANEDDYERMLDRYNVVKDEMARLKYNNEPELESLYHLFNTIKVYLY